MKALQTHFTKSYGSLGAAFIFALISILPVHSKNTPYDVKYRCKTYLTVSNTFTDEFKRRATTETVFGKSGDSSYNKGFIDFLDHDYPTEILEVQKRTPNITNAEISVTLSAPTSNGSCFF